MNAWNNNAHSSIAKTGFALISRISTFLNRTISPLKIVHLWGVSYHRQENCVTVQMSNWQMSLFQFLLSATKLWQGNVFTPVCHSIHRGGCLPLDLGGMSATPPWADTHPGRHPSVDTSPGRHPPAQCMLGYILPCAVDAGIWSTSGRYASSWNAYLLI